MLLTKLPVDRKKDIVPFNYSSYYTEVEYNDLEIEMGMELLLNDRSVRVIMMRIYYIRVRSIESNMYCFYADQLVFICIKLYTTKFILKICKSNPLLSEKPAKCTLKY